MTSRFLITGITSIHGWPIFTYFQSHYPGQVMGVKNGFAPQPPLGEHVVAIQSEDYSAIEKLCRDFQPSHIIHCSGLCDLDVAEDYPERAYTLNVQGARNIYAQAHDCRLVYLSYDLIFSGQGHHPDGYTEQAIPDPLTVVGKTIVEAENILAGLENHLIIRLALPMGASIQGNKGAVDWIESRFRKQRMVTLLYDEVRSTINTADIGPAVHDLMMAEYRGIVNLGSPGKISLYDIGARIVAAKLYPAHLLEGKWRTEFPPSPPRMGDVSLNSQLAYHILGWIPQTWDYGPLCQSSML